MNNDLISELNRLKQKTKCSRNYQCILNISKLHCKAKYYALADLMECLDDQPEDCEFSRPFSSTFICTCKLRKVIAIHYEEI